jgi:hypothetical protein
VASSTNGDRRSPYFDVACCPANLARLIAQLPGLIYSTRGNEIFVNLFVNSEADVTINGAKVHIKQTTNYPWDGKTTIQVTASRATSVTLKTRVPGWLGQAPFGTDLYTFTAPVAGAPSGGWKDTAITASARPVTTSLNFPMPVRRVIANENLKEDAGKTAIMRGPIVYAFEGVDNGGKALDITLPATAVFIATAQPSLLGGVTTLSAKVGERTITAVPYFAWANRARGEMAVWVRQ